jgi:predicted AAA+ superfamily ATPase
MREDAMERRAMRELIAWKHSPARKPLLLRGARQVGKTWLAQEFGRAHYDNVVYANLDTDPAGGMGQRLAALFAETNNPHRIIQALAAVFDTDVGLLAAMANVDPAAMLVGDDAFTEFRGPLTEQFVHQQLVAHAPGGHYGARPYYWAGKMAEIDFVMQFGSAIVPIEVKAAENLRSRSLRSYIDRFAPAAAIRTSLSPHRPEATFTNVPLYAVEQIPQIIAEHVGASA